MPFKYREVGDKFKYRGNILLVRSANHWKCNKCYLGENGIGGCIPPEVFRCEDTYLVKANYERALNFLRKDKPNA